MKNIFYSFTILLGTITLGAKAQDAMQTTARGAQYQIFTHNPGEKVKQNDGITFH
jgi:FKBP-type peptidyl-prolyl cis-trans isomerase FkpA